MVRASLGSMGCQSIIHVNYIPTNSINGMIIFRKKFWKCACGLKLLIELNRWRLSSGRAGISFKVSKGDIEMKYLFMLIFIALFYYSIGTFIYDSFYSSTWNHEGKISLSIFYGMTSLISLIILLFHDLNKDEKSWCTSTKTLIKNQTAISGSSL